MDSGSVKRSGAIALFANYKQQADVARTLFQQAFDCANHRRNDALGIAGAASPDELVILAHSEEWRHGIDVRGERNSRFAQRQKC